MKSKVLSTGGKEVVIGDDLPTVLIGERINPFGKNLLREAFTSGVMEPVREEASKQVEAGADILNVSVNAFGIDESIVLPTVVSEVMKTVDVPLCLESRNPIALEKTLMLGCGKPIISSVTGESGILDEILPLVQKYNTLVVAIASDASGIPKDPVRRLQIIREIIDRMDKMNIAREDILVDCIAESIAVNGQATLATLETMKLVRRELGLNLVLGASNVSFGLPNRTVVNSAFLSMAIQSGLNCAIVNVAKMKPHVMAIDLLLGRDQWARQYIAYYRKSKNDSPH